MFEKFKLDKPELNTFGDVAKSITLERQFLVDVLEKIASTSDSYESKLARHALNEINKD